MAIKANHAVHLGIATCTPIPLVPGPNGLRLAPVTMEWVRAKQSIQFPTNFSMVDVYRDGMEIGEARQSVIEYLLGLERRPEFLFFLDYDVIPAHDAITKLVMRARHFPDHDVFAGVYCSKSEPSEPLIYGANGAGPFWDWRIGDILHEDQIHSCHMGLTLLRMSLFDRFTEEQLSRPLFLTENEAGVTDDGTAYTNRGTEDIYFCTRATAEIGLRILVDTSVLAGHIDNGSGRIFGLGGTTKPGTTPWMVRGEEYDKQKKAIDIGAGGTRREWPEHKTYTTDIRSDSKPDYVQDSRCLNLPANEFDLVASSHHLEHIGRWDQEDIWRQMFTICKPGGFIEHVVPNVRWAADMIVDGKIDEHVLNVLYGAQEAHGYAREFNTHFFGYTPDVATALAENAGFVDVSIEDYHFDANLGYNMIIRGRKPRPDEPANPIEPAPAAVAESEGGKKKAGKNGRVPNRGRWRDGVTGRNRKLASVGKSRNQTQSANRKAARSDRRGGRAATGRR